MESLSGGRRGLSRPLAPVNKRDFTSKPLANPPLGRLKEPKSGLRTPGTPPSPVSFVMGASSGREISPSIQGLQRICSPVSGSSTSPFLKSPTASGSLAPLVGGAPPHSTTTTNSATPKAHIPSWAVRDAPGGGGGRRGLRKRRERGSGSRSPLTLSPMGGSTGSILLRRRSSTWSGPNDQEGSKCDEPHPGAGGRALKIPQASPTAAGGSPLPSRPTTGSALGSGSVSTSSKKYPMASIGGAAAAAGGSAASPFLMPLSRGSSRCSSPVGGGSGGGGGLKVEGGNSPLAFKRNSPLRRSSSAVSHTRGITNNHFRGDIRGEQDDDSGDEDIGNVVGRGGMAPGSLLFLNPSPVSTSPSSRHSRVSAAPSGSSLPQAPGAKSVGALPPAPGSNIKSPDQKIDWGWGNKGKNSPLGESVVSSARRSGGSSKGGTPLQRKSSPLRYKSNLATPPSKKSGSPVPLSPLTPSQSTPFVSNKNNNTNKKSPLNKKQPSQMPALSPIS